VDTGKPYKDIEVGDNYVIREFGENIDPIELMWHRDNEDRVVEVLNTTDWKFQYDNQLPILLKENVSLKIARHDWHRVIKGNGDLKVKITAGRDLFHLNRPGSPHNPGKALDFTVGVTNRVVNSKVNPNDYTTEEREVLDNIVNLLDTLKSNGVKISYIDEYRYPSAGSSGGHFHIKAT
jgi:hypothetical protein